MVGERQKIEIGYMSGASNVTHWLSSRGYDPHPDLVQRILRAAKECTRVLREDEILAVVREHQSAAKPQ